MIQIDQGCTQLQHVSFTLTLLWMVPTGVVQCPTFIVVKGCAALYLLIFPAPLQLSYICELQLSQFQLLLLSRGTTVLLGLFVIDPFIYVLSMAAFAAPWPWGCKSKILTVWPFINLLLCISIYIYMCLYISLLTPAIVIMHSRQHREGQILNIIFFF